MESAIQTMVKVFLKSSKGKENLGKSQFQSLVKSQLSNILTDTDSKEAVNNMGQELDANQDGKVGFEEYLKLVGYLAVSLSEQRNLAKEEPAQNAVSGQVALSSPGKEEEKPAANSEANEEAKPEANKEAKVEAVAEVKVEEKAEGNVKLTIKSEVAKQEEKPAAVVAAAAAAVEKAALEVVVKEEEKKEETEKVEKAIGNLAAAVEAEVKIEEATS
ncbi:S100 calcium binding protein U [Perca fluviatilis]|nr:S100 calcium binding protein U [Perca fluviatilis]